jgi:glycosyltransferase involved in cell wall biosynthesis
VPLALRGDDPVVGQDCEAVAPFDEVAPGPALKVLLCHNYYQVRGGEDESFEAEGRLLEARGHPVVRYTVHNDAVEAMGRWGVARRALWNPETYRRVRELIRRERPALMHCTNTFPLLSPAVYYAARAEGVAVVQSLRNYRLLCPNGLFLREGRVCEDCLGRSVPWPAVRHGCYRESRAASAVVAALTGGHRALGTWARAVDMYFTPSAFARSKFVQAGWPGAWIAVNPCFVHPDPGPGAGAGGYAVYVGRLSPEKGIDTLLAGWARLGGRIPLKVIGDGPLTPEVQAACRDNPAVQWLGRRPLAEVLEILGDAAFVVLPSIVYETLGRTVIEGFARGTPAVVSRLGAMAEVVADGLTGLHFQPGNPDDLTTKVAHLLDSPHRLMGMRAAARTEFENKYTADHNYRVMQGIYGRALARLRR